MTSDTFGSHLKRSIPILEHKNLHKHTPNQDSKSGLRETLSNFRNVVFWISCATVDNHRCFILQRMHRLYARRFYTRIHK